MKAAIAAILLAGCGATSNYQREHEVEANLPRAMGLGVFTPACIFFCFPTMTMTHGDDTIDPSATEALMHSKESVQSQKQGGAGAATVKKKSSPLKGTKP